jgi:hypothetical protein
MRVKIFSALIVVFLIALVTGCYYDIVKPADLNKPPENVSFSGDVQAIFDKNCNSPDCHGGNHQPSLTTEDAYNSLITGGFINTTVPTESILYKVVNSGEMPPTGALSSSDQQKILDWIRLGAPNN